MDCRTSGEAHGRVLPGTCTLLLQGPASTDVHNELHTEHYCVVGCKHVVLLQRTLRRLQHVFVKVGDANTVCTLVAHSKAKPDGWNGSERPKSSRRSLSQAFEASGTSMILAKDRSR